MAMTSVLVDRKFEIVVCHYNFLYSTGGAPKCRRAPDNLPPSLPLDGRECVNNALINALKNNT